MKDGVSNIYKRVLRGECTAEHYVAVLKRAVDMRIARRPFPTNATKPVKIKR